LGVRCKEAFVGPAGLRDAAAEQLWAGRFEAPGLVVDDLEITITKHAKVALTCAFGYGYALQAF
jgi:hypothetical protein